MNGPATCPTPFEVSAALHVAEVFRTEPLQAATLDASLHFASTGGLIQPIHLRSAAARLRACGLLVEDASGFTADPRLLVVAELDRSEAEVALFALMMQAVPPVWTSAASDGTDVAPEFIPEEDRRTIERMLPDPAAREAFLIALGRRFNDEADRLLGQLGEEATVAACAAELTRLRAPELAARVRRVSALSDQLGYDVTSPSVNGGGWRIEVKTTRRVAEHAAINLSRNEARVAERDQGWALLVCQATLDGGARVVGWCAGSQLISRLPLDANTRGEWTSARLLLDSAELQPGVPDLSAGP